MKTMNKIKLGIGITALAVAGYGAYQVREVLRNSMKANTAEILPQPLSVSKATQTESITYKYDVFKYGDQAAFVRPIQPDENAFTAKGSLEDRLNFAFMPETEATQTMNLTDKIVCYQGSTYVPVSTGEKRMVELRAPVELQKKKTRTETEDQNQITLKELSIQTRKINGDTYIFTPFNRLTTETEEKYAQLGSTNYLPFGLIYEPTAKVEVVRKNGDRLGTVRFTGELYIPIKAEIKRVTPTPTPTPIPTNTPVPSPTVAPTKTPRPTPSPTPEYTIFNP